MKRLFFAALALLMAVALVCCAPAGNGGQPEESSVTTTPVDSQPEESVETTAPADYQSEAEAEAEYNPEMGKSLTQINQEMLAGEWKQIVQDKSLFQLGDTIDYTGPDADGTGRYTVDYGSYPKMDGSTVCVPMAMEFARQYLDLEDETVLKLMAMFSTTHDAYYNLISKQPVCTAMIGNHELDYYRPVDIILATKPSEYEMQMAAENDVKLYMKPICMDAFVFITHEDNPVDNLTQQQIRDIYTGRITNWKQVGGPDMEITAYQRTPNSGSQTAMESMVMKGEAMQQAPSEQISSDMGDLVDSIKNYDNSPGSIGYTYKYYLDNLYNDEGVKVLAVDGIYPDDESIRWLKYPFFDYYYGVIRDNEPDSLGRRFLEWIQSEEGQQCVEQAGYIRMLESQ